LKKIIDNWLLTLFSQNSYIELSLLNPKVTIASDRNTHLRAGCKREQEESASSIEVETK